jgi:hypothetical protein
VGGVFCVAETPLALAAFAAGEEKEAVVGSVQRLGRAAGSLAFGAGMWSLHAKTSKIRVKATKIYLKRDCVPP